MRYESAMQILGFLRDSYGTPVPIRRIAQNIDLSYQPTYKHVRALEGQGVIATAKTGRDVLCELRCSEATHVWLSLLAMAERESLLAGPRGELVALVRQTVRQVPSEGLQAVAVRTETGSPDGVLLLAEEPLRESLVARFSARCASLDPTARVEAYSATQLAAMLTAEDVRRSWVTQVKPVLGEQAFWAALLPCQAHD